MCAQSRLVESCVAVSTAQKIWNGGERFSGISRAQVLLHR
jgi:hypothetical protein